MTQEGIYIELSILNFFGPVCEQTLGLIKIHQTPVWYEPITLHPKKRKAKRKEEINTLTYEKLEGRKERGRGEKENENGSD